MFGDALERFERETAAVIFMFPRGGKAERGIALCGAWELSVRAILLPFQTDRKYVAESVAKSVFATLSINITSKILHNRQQHPQRYSLERSPC